MGEGAGELAHLRLPGGLIRIRREDLEAFEQRHLIPARIEAAQPMRRDPIAIARELRIEQKRLRAGGQSSGRPDPFELGRAMRRSVNQIVRAN